LKDLASKESSGGDHFTGGDFEGVEVLLRNGDPDRHPSGKLDQRSDRFIE